MQTFDFVTASGPDLQAALHNLKKILHDEWSAAKCKIQNLFLLQEIKAPEPGKLHVAGQPAVQINFTLVVVLVADDHVKDLQFQDLYDLLLNRIPKRDPLND